MSIAKNTSNDKIQDALKGDPVRLRLGCLTAKPGGFHAYGELLGNSPVLLGDYIDKAFIKLKHQIIGDKPRFRRATAIQ